MAAPAGTGSGTTRVLGVASILLVAALVLFGLVLTDPAPPPPEGQGDAMRLTSPFSAASNSCPSVVSESTCALRARQLGKPYSLARSRWASASRRSGSRARSSASLRRACLRSHSRFGASGSADVARRVGSDMGTSIPLKGMSLSGRPLSAAGARNRS